MQLTVIILVISLIDLFTSDWAPEVHQGLENQYGLANLALRSILRMDLELCNLSAKLGLHDNIQIVLLVCVFLVPFFLYIIKVSTYHIYHMTSSLYPLATKFLAKTLSSN